MLTPEIARTAVEDAGSIAGAAKALGVPRRTLRSVLERALARKATQLEEEVDTHLPPQGFVVKKNSITYDKNGEVKSHSIGSTIAPGETYEIPAGHIIKGESALLDANGQLISRWVKTKESEAAHLIQALDAAFRKYEAQAPSLLVPTTNENHTLTVYPLPDLHFGMYAWKKETGADYDTDIASQLASDALKDLVVQSRPSKRAVLLGLGDYFHQNDQRNATPKSGHRLDVDGRWSKVYTAGAELMLKLVDLIASKHEIVDVVMLPGNHDEDAAITLRVALSLFYKKNSRIQVYNEPGLTWYDRFGLVLMGAAHGHTLKADRMAMMLATDRPKDWGETLYRHFFFGHIHHETTKEVGPVRVESFQTPAARDAYAQDGGYRSGRSLSAVTFHQDKGEIGRHRVNILSESMFR